MHGASKHTGKRLDNFLPAIVFGDGILRTMVARCSKGKADGGGRNAVSKQHRLEARQLPWRTTRVSARVSKRWMT